MNKKSTIFLLLLSLIATSCVNKLTYPGRLTYQITSSADFFSLFRINVTYTDDIMGSQSITMTDNTWSKSMLKTDVKNAELSVTLVARDPSGSTLTKDSYTMSFLPEILYDPNLTAVEETKAEDGEMPLNGVYSKDQMKKYLQLYNGHTVTVTL